MEEYRAGTTLFIEHEEGCESQTQWWMDPTVNKVVRYDLDTGYVMIAEREGNPPVIRSWLSPQTFESELRLTSRWLLTHKYNSTVSTETIDLPVNMTKYTLEDRIRKVA